MARSMQWFSEVFVGTGELAHLSGQPGRVDVPFEGPHLEVLEEAGAGVRGTRSKGALVFDGREVPPQ